MAKCFVALAALLTTGCATLDTSRPIEKGSFLWADQAEQNGHALNVWTAREQFLNFEVSRSAAQRSITEHYVGLGMLVGGVGGYVAGAVTNQDGVKAAGVGLALLSIIPSLMADSDFWRAVGLYNTRFQATPSASQLTIEPYLAAETKGGTVGVSGQF